MDLLNYFDGCYLINLERRSDRLTAANAKLAALGWPFKTLEVVKAVDGSKLAVPRHFRSGEGAWGCRQTHLRILENAQIQGLKKLLILEDDFYFPSPATFKGDLAKFLLSLPSNWEVLMLGGQHIGNHGGEYSPGVVKCINTQRTHAYAVQGRAIGELYQLWSNTTDHIDWSFKQYMPSHNVYAPDPFLIGQDCGKSDVNGADNPKKLWRQPKANAPVYWFRNTPRQTVEKLRSNGFHFGWRLDIQGEDVGLNPIWKSINERVKPTMLRKWIETIDWESASTDKTGTAIWSLEADEALIRSVCGERLVEVDNPTVEEAHAALEKHGGSI